jgi:hypothetical protein
MKLTNIILLSFVILSNVNRNKRMEVDIILWRPYICRMLAYHLHQNCLYINDDTNNFLSNRMLFIS